MMGSKSAKDIQLYRRRAHHAGSWYQGSHEELATTLQNFLNDASIPSLDQPLRAVICPHAGYSYSGPTAAFSYLAVKQELSKANSPINTILVLHPSHHVYLEGCAISGASIIETPIGNLVVDTDLRQELLSTGEFEVMEQTVDEQEHSGEMQYPYLASLVMGKAIKVLPIMCGALSTQAEIHYGRVLTDVIRRPNVITVMSTDFCHWGKRFSYQPTGENFSPHEFIQQLDEQGMKHISMQDPGAFAEYLKQTKNTICGRHAVAVWLRAISPSDDLNIRFVKYAQSSPARNMRDSSVSYASAVVTKTLE